MRFIIDLLSLYWNKVICRLIRLPWNLSLWIDCINFWILEPIFMELGTHITEPESEVEVTLRLTVSQSVSQYVLVSSTLVGLATRYYFLLVCCCLKFAVLAPSLTRGRVCNLRCNHLMVRVAQNPKPYFIVASESESELLYGWRSVSQYVLVSSPLCGRLTRYCFLFKCLGLKFFVVSLWDALSAERPGLSFVSSHLRLISLLFVCISLSLLDNGSVKRYLRKECKSNNRRIVGHVVSYAAPDASEESILLLPITSCMKFP
jgi:hypothetical protein